MLVTIQREREYLSCKIGLVSCANELCLLGIVIVSCKTTMFEIMQEEECLLAAELF